LVGSFDGSGFEGRQIQLVVVALMLMVISIRDDFGLIVSAWLVGVVVI
jgi:hypothetical protein